MCAQGLAEVRREDAPSWPRGMPRWLNAPKYRKFEGVFVSNSDRPARQTNTDRGIAMIPLTHMGLYFALAAPKQRKKRQRCALLHRHHIVPVAVRASRPVPDQDFRMNDGCDALFGGIRGAQSCQLARLKTTKTAENNENAAA